MSEYYFDLESEGLDPGVDKITTIQYQKLGFNTGKPVSELVILKAWESSEKQILEEFAKVFGPEEEKWSFISTGYNLHFEEKFLRERCIANALPPIMLFSKPSLDLHPIGILMAGGFKGSGLDKITGKEGNGLQCLNHYNAKEYDKVTDYIKQEAAEYLRFYVWLRQRMPKLMTEFHVDCL